MYRGGCFKELTLVIRRILWDAVDFELNRDCIIKRGHYNMQWRGVYFRMIVINRERFDICFAEIINTVD